MCPTPLFKLNHFRNKSGSKFVSSFQGNRLKSGSGHKHLCVCACVCLSIKRICRGL